MTRTRPHRSRTSPLVALVAAGAAAGCAARARADYVGRTLPSLVEADAIVVHRGKETPAGHTVLGVATATCSVYDGASGVLEDRCDEATMLDALRDRSARSGGTVLVDPVCETRVLERSVERLTNGGAKGHLRTELRCRGTVARREDSAPAVRATTEPSGLPVTTARVTIAGTPVTLGWDRDAVAKPGSPRSPDDVGELDRMPTGARSLGRIRAECDADCSSSVARRGLRHAAARLGGVAVVDARCDAIGERWHCDARAVGE